MMVPQVQWLYIVSIRIFLLNDELQGVSFGISEDGFYIQQGDEMYLVKNKPLEISSWYYQVNGGQTNLILNTEDYKTLSITKNDGKATMRIYGKADTEIEIEIGPDGYYNIEPYDETIIRLTNSVYVVGTITNIRLA